MSIIEILMYSIGSVFFLSALIFTYYSIKVARIMKGALGRIIMAYGALLFIVAGVIGAIDALFFPGSGLVYGEFLIWVLAFGLLFFGGFSAGKVAQKTYSGSILKGAFIYKRGLFYLVAFVVLTFIGLPIFILDTLPPLRIGFSWYSVILIIVHAFCFVNLAIGARMDYKAVAQSGAAAAAAAEETEKKRAAELEKAYTDLEYSRDKLESIYRITKAVSSTLELERLLDLILQLTCKILKADGGSIMLFDENTKELVVKSAAGTAKDVVIGKRFKIGERFAGRSFQSGKPILVHDVEEEEWFKALPKYEVIKSGMSVPIEATKGKLIGVLNLKRTEREENFTHDDMELVSQFSRNIALAIENSRLYEKERKQRRELEKSQEASLNVMEDLERQRKELENALKKLRETQAKLVQSEKLASVGQLAAGVAHEINNPLASILLGAQRMSDMIKKQVKAIPGSKVYLRNLERMEKSTNRCKKIVAGLLAFSRPTKIELGPTDINKVIEETLEPLEEQVKAQDVRVIKGFAPSLPIIEADGQQLSQVFSNLIVNACEAMPKGGQLRIITRLQTPEGGVQSDASGEVGKTVEIEFSDTGGGIPKEDLFRVFDPFFTTKETGKGVGLGLSVSYGIIEEHGGTIEVRSEKGKGGTFIVGLPVKI